MIYAIRAVGTEFIKFGVAHNLQKRLQHLQIGSPFKLEIVASCHGRHELEATIHYRLIQAGLHIRGEWFRTGPETSKVIREIKDASIKTNEGMSKTEIIIANRRLSLPNNLERRSGEWKLSSKHLKLHEARKQRTRNFPRVRARQSELTPAQAARRIERELWWAERSAATLP